MTLESLPILITLGFLLGGWCYANWRDHQLVGKALIYLTADEEKQLQNCFPSSIYYLGNIEYRVNEILCYGQLRSPNFKYSYDTVRHNLQQAFGDRFLCYLQEEPSANFSSEHSDLMGNASELGNYYFHIVDAPKLLSSRYSRKRLIAKSTISAVFTFITLIVWGNSSNLLLQLNLASLAQSFPYAIAVSFVFMVRAIAQNYVTHKYQIPFVPPLYIPWLGNFGLLTSFQQAQQNATTTKVTVKQQRQVLFDLGIFPIVAGLITSTLLIVLGNWFFLPMGQQLADTLAPNPNNPFANIFEFQSSILAALIHSICQAIAPNQLTAQSPFTLAGWTGLAISAVQVLPFEFLDGGNLAIAMYNHQQVRKIAQISRLLILAIALLVQPWLRVYALLLFVLPMPRPLVLNEGLEIDHTRDYIGMAIMAIALLIILPLPK